MYKTFEFRLTIYLKIINKKNQNDMNKYFNENKRN